MEYPNFFTGDVKPMPKEEHFSGMNMINMGSWTLAEDERLRAAVTKYGTKWKTLAQAVGSRNGEQCAKRWRNALNPVLDHGPWADREDRHLLRLVTKHGRNWKLIAEHHVKPRSSLALKNRHALLLRRQKRSERRKHGQGSALDQDMSDKTSTPPSEDYNNNHFDEGMNWISPFHNQHKHISTSEISGHNAGHSNHLDSLLPLDISPMLHTFSPDEQISPGLACSNFGFEELGGPSLEPVVPDWDEVGIEPSITENADPLSIGPSSNADPTKASGKRELLSLTIPCSKSRRQRLVRSLLDAIGSTVDEKEEGFEAVRISMVAD
ncbi:hypothetical protein NUU61_008204 [Penicillium alfredii]|uniref:Uncharacterized protein n=1 Tax=Penicillium alfredii TaxID=1506179 RepID=A0A9W9JZT6_9EURO|nr:uncharacterized protein NUU61_008204 [Penicillium alfredii]KAJ5086897.1 hypothetical protein NUU61_008204 [Penicillium alfredii]